jgi:hypothetical protein
MGQLVKRGARSLGAAVALVVGALLVQAQASGPGGDTPGVRAMDQSQVAVTTQQRLETEAWWPTMSTMSLEKYATGTGSCVGCHTDEKGTAEGTAMSRAAARAGDESFRVDAGADQFSTGTLSYSLRMGAEGLDYSVASADATASARLRWIMGAGDLGRTFVYKRDDRWFQSRVSEYRQAPRLDVTTGLKIPEGMDVGGNLADALGKALTPAEVRNCFGCHTVHATSSKGFDPEHAQAGLGCEACHGPGAAHNAVTAAKGAAAKGAAGVDLAIFNPAKLSPADSIDFCGACHRTFGDVTEAANPANDPSVVRFQPYRLEKSRCWRESEDARLTCVACHDPHEPLVREDSSYDKRCLACHKPGAMETHGAKICPTGAKTQCVSCHMPKVKVASMHGEFTDHFIRVFKAGEEFPK